MSPSRSARILPHLRHCVWCGSSGSDGRGEESPVGPSLGVVRVPIAVQAAPSAGRALAFTALRMSTMLSTSAAAKTILVRSLQDLCKATHRAEPVRLFRWW